MWWTLSLTGDYDTHIDHNERIAWRSRVSAPVRYEGLGGRVVDIRETATHRHEHHLCVSHEALFSVVHDACRIKFITLSNMQYFVRSCKGFVFVAQSTR